MTAAALLLKRDKILAHCDVVRTSKGDRSVEYAEATKALAILDREIARATALEASTARIRQIRLYSQKGL
jgi:RecB family exonuclease